jgi:two-component system sensor histidine kinase EvgS
MKEETAPNTSGNSIAGPATLPCPKQIEGQTESAIFAPGNRELLGMLGHDLRAPLNWMLGFLELLDQTKLDADQHACLSTVKLCGADLLDTLTGILDGVKADTGHLKLNEEWNDLREVISAAVKVFRAQAALHEISFDWNVNAGVARWWYCDRAKLRQILANLLGNALKFTPKGAVRLEVDTVADSGGGQVLRMIVRDTGIGISKKDLAHLFEPFRQGSAPQGRPLAGSGLGLAIVQQLTEALRGSVDIRCPASGGTDVTLLFPWAQAEVAP